MLARVADRERNRPAELSGGERPPVLLADEPTGSLDSEAGRQVLDLLERIRNKHSTTLVLVTHDAGVAACADRIVHMLDGHVDVASADLLPVATASWRGQPS